MRIELAEDWKEKILYFWSIRIAILWSVINALVAIWSAFQDVMPLWLFCLLAIAMNVAICVARITKQPGLD